MDQLEYDKWIVEYDKKATQEIYSSIEKGDPEVCECGYCANFVAGRKYYPHDFINILSQIGIDHKKEFEVWCLDLTEKGSYYFYCGGFNFIGTIVKEPLDDFFEDIIPESPEIQFVCSFSYNTGLAQKEFKELIKAGVSVASVDFKMTIPWLLDLPLDMFPLKK
jgi:hypothetical protein